MALNQAPNGGRFQPHLLRPSTEDLNFSRFVFSFERTIRQVSNLSQTLWLPPKRTHVFSLTLVGSPYGSQGIPCRAEYPRKQEILRKLSQHFISTTVMQGTKRHFEHFPGYLTTDPELKDLEVEESDRTDAGTAWKQRHTRYNRYRKGTSKK